MGDGGVLLADRRREEAVGQGDGRDESGGEGEERETACKIRTSTGVAEWGEETGLKVLWMGDEFATGSTAVRDGKRRVGVVSGLYERGLLVWRE